LAESISSEKRSPRSSAVEAVDNTAVTDTVEAVEVEDEVEEDEAGAAEDEVDGAGTGVVEAGETEARMGRAEVRAAIVRLPRACPPKLRSAGIRYSLGSSRWRSVGSFW
jgi:hypothetical protein